MTAYYGYQDEANVVTALELANREGLGVELEDASYFVDHVSLAQTGHTPMAKWRKRLFAILYQNSTPAARYYRVPPDRVLEIGAYVEI